MNEAAFDRVFPSRTLSSRIFGTSDSRMSGAFYGYSLFIIALGTGWVLRDRGLVSASDGPGYWLGIIGSSLMLLLLLYPVRKRFRALRFLGGTSHWFRLHMILGLLGPLLVLYHSNFRIGSFNSQVALYCMLLVAGSGVIGRHLYAGIHEGLYGRKTSLKDLRRDLASSQKDNKGLALLLPRLATRLASLSAEIEGDGASGSMGVVASLKWVFRRYPVWFFLVQLARTELRAQAVVSPAIARDLPRMAKSTSPYIRNFVRLASHIARFTLYERLFSLWHVLHLPLFFMLIISALVHVLAVHMY